jgi:hypothetical protein
MKTIQNEKGPTTWKKKNKLERDLNTWRNQTKTLNKIGNPIVHLKDLSLKDNANSRLI